MTTMRMAAMVLVAACVAGAVRADDPNPDVAKAIQEIAARRAEKEEARAKQAQTWVRSETRENSFIGGAQINAAPGQTIKLNPAPQK